MEYNIKNEILTNQNEILLRVDIESIDVYRFLRDEYKKGSINSNNVFQFVFRSYYRLDNAGLGDALKKKYFELLANRQDNLKKILLELYRIPTLRNFNAVQFSFATKLLHTIDTNNPIFDSEVSEVIHKRVTGKNMEEKIESCLKIYDSLKSTYMMLLQDKEIKNLILKFREKFRVDENDMPDMKVLDSIVWSLGKLMKKKVNGSGGIK